MTFGWSFKISIIQRGLLKKKCIFLSSLKLSIMVFFYQITNTCRIKFDFEFFISIFKNIFQCILNKD